MNLKKALLFALGTSIISVSAYYLVQAYPELGDYLSIVVDTAKRRLGL